MTPQQFEGALKETLTDHRLSRPEKAALSDCLGPDLLDHQKLSLYRSIAFRLAGEAMKDADASLVLEWLERVNKVLLPPAHTCQALFSPGHECVERIVSMLGAATKSLDLCVFTITDDRIKRAISDVKTQGRVAIRIISDWEKCQAPGSDVMPLCGEGVPVKLSRAVGHMHHKFGIFDARQVLTGSYNWTVAAAQENFENVVVSDDPRLVASFSEEFERLWAGL